MRLFAYVILAQRLAKELSAIRGRVLGQICGNGRSIILTRRSIEDLFAASVNGGRRTKRQPRPRYARDSCSTGMSEPPVTFVTHIKREVVISGHDSVRAHRDSRLPRDL